MILLQTNSTTFPVFQYLLLAVILLSVVYFVFFKSRKKDNKNANILENKEVSKFNSQIEDSPSSNLPKEDSNYDMNKLSIKRLTELLKSHKTTRDGFVENLGFSKLDSTRTDALGPMDIFHKNNKATFYLSRFAISHTDSTTSSDELLKETNELGFEQILNRNEKDGKIITYKKKEFQVDFKNPHDYLSLTVYITKPDDFDSNFNDMVYLSTGPF
jgi:cbb3-type cytochrome oxidase subunit 3